MVNDDITVGVLIAGISFGVGFGIVCVIVQGLITITEFPGTLFLGDQIIAPLSQIWYTFAKSVPPALLGGGIAIPIGFIIMYALGD